MGTNNIKVLHVIHSLSGGGAETQLKILLRESENVGIENHLYCVNPNAELTPDTKRYCCRRPARYYLSAYGELYRLVRDIKPDLVHVWLPPTLTIPSLVAAKLNGVPCVTSFRNKMFFDSWLRRVDFFMQVLLSSGIISNNPPEQSHRFYQWLYRRKSGQQIANAIDMPKKYVGSALKNTNSSRLLFVGRLSPQKNLAVVIEALASIEDLQGLYLDVFGQGELEDELKQLVVSKGLEHAVIFHGFCSNIYQEMAKGGVLVLPSVYEGMPNVLVEAMRCGMPCIASNIPANRAVLKDGDEALLFEPKSSLALAAIIKKMLADEVNLNALADKGNQLSESFLPHILASKYKLAYNNILNIK